MQQTNQRAIPRAVVRRRQVLRLLTAGGAGLGAAALLAACGAAGGTVTGSVSAATAATTSAAPTASSSASSTAAAPSSSAAASSAAGTSSASAAAASNAAPAGSKAGLSMWTTWGDKDADAEKAMLAAFSRQQPGITVELQTVTDQDKFTAAMASGSPPDLLQTWNAALVATWATSGGVVLLDPYISASKLDLAALDRGGLDAGKLFGKQYGMPMLVYTNTLLFWNKSLFEKAGLDPSTPPDTWQTLNEYAAHFTEKSNGAISRLGFVPGGMFGQGGLGNVVWSFGGQLYSDDGKQVTPDAPGVVRCAEYQRDQISQFGGLDALSAFTKTFGKNADDPFYTSLVAMQVNGEWLPTFVAKYKPDLRYGIGYLPYDQAAPQAKDSGNIGTNLIIIPKDSKHAQDAWEVIAFANTPAPNLALAKVLGNTPQVLAAADQLAQEATTPELKFIVAAHKSRNMRAQPINPVSNDYNKALGTAIGDINSGKKQAPAALAEVKQIIQPKLDALAGKG